MYHVLYQSNFLVHNKIGQNGQIVYIDYEAG